MVLREDSASEWQAVLEQRFGLRDFGMANRFSYL
jgi:hypothetical protein